MNSKSISLLTLLLIPLSLETAEAQRYGRGASRPSRGRGYSTATARSRARSLSAKADLKRTAQPLPWIDRPVSAPPPHPGEGERAPVPAMAPRTKELIENERDVLAGLQASRSRMKTLTYRGYLSLKPKGRSSKRVSFDYYGRYDRDEGRAYHRFRIKTRPERRIVIHERFGGKSTGWMITKEVRVLTNPLTTPLVEDAPALVVDALPLEPLRFRLQLEGEGNHAGSSVWYLIGSLKGGRATARIAVRKSGLLPIHAQVFKEGKLTRELTASRLQLNGGVLAYSQRQVSGADSDVRMDLVCRERRVNGEVPMSLFAPPE